MNTKEKIGYLRKKIMYHRYLYEELNSPIISDYEFDMMYKELKELESKYPEFFDPNSPTQIVGWIL